MSNASEDWIDKDGWRAPSNDQLLTYEQAAEYLDLSYSRIADLVHKGVLHPEPPPPSYPNRKLKLLKLSELMWYNTQRPQPKAALTPPASATSPTTWAKIRSTLEAGLRYLEPDVATPLGVQVNLDTLATLRQYVEQHMAGSEEAGQLDTLLAKVAGHIAVTLALSTAEQLPQEERAQLTVLLAALTQKGR